MLPLDANALYDLPQAARRLLADPEWLRRQLRHRRIPGASGPDGPVLPRAWVDAEAGTEPADADALAAYWLERLAPAAPEAARPSRDRAHLPVEDLLDAPEAARRVTADPAFLRRLDAEGVLPALQVDGEARYDARLVGLVATESEAATTRNAADARRAEVLDWTRYAWVTGLDAGAALPPARTRSAAPESLRAAPRAWHLPDDLREETGEAGSVADEAAPVRPRRPRLAEADGYETVDED